ncbi:MAG: hypothetical protein ACK52P_22745 [Alphaproteobacteria bacterium]
MSVKPTTTSMTRAETIALVLLTLSQLVLFLIPVIVLGQAIGWPASLRLPANQALPLVAANPLAIQIGYWGYLLTAVAMVPFGIALRRFAMAHGAGGMLTDTMAAFAIAAGILKTLGIVRWLTTMPMLADLYVATSDPAARAIIEVNYMTLYAFGGGLGELLGVQLVSGLWLISLGLVFQKLDMRINAIISAVLGIAFALTAFRTMAPALNALSAAVPPFALVWLIALAVTFWRRGSSTKEAEKHAA